jgi:hypothetical protein
MDHKEIGCGLDLCGSRYPYQAPVNVVMNFWVPLKVGNFLISGVTMSFL